MATNQRPFKHIRNKYNEQQLRKFAQNQINEAALAIVLKQRQQQHEQILLDTALSFVNSLIINLGYRKLESTQPEDLESTQSEQLIESNASRYKTELCRRFDETGNCKYHNSCQFAHGTHELRTKQRHPKYKSELCRKFHSIGMCRYGGRCHFVHNIEEAFNRNDNDQRVRPSIFTSTTSEHASSRTGSLSSLHSFFIERPFSFSSNGFNVSLASDTLSSAGTLTPLDNHSQQPFYNQLDSTIEAFKRLAM